MSDPFIDALATALAGQAVTALGSAGTAALSKIRELVRGKSAEDPELGTALEAAQDPSAGQEHVRALAERLDQNAAADQAFGQQLRSEGAPVYNDISATGNGVVNEFSGQADKVIQARDVHGGITLN